MTSIDSNGLEGSRSASTPPMATDEAGNTTHNNHIAHDRHVAQISSDHRLEYTFCCSIYACMNNQQRLKQLIICQ